MNNETKNEIVSWVQTIVFAIIIALVINNFVIVNATVPTGSMENIIMPDDRIVAFRLSYMFNEPERGDIVVFKFPDNEKLLYVKRVIGIPGDKIEIKNGAVYRNGELLKEDYIKEPMFTGSSWGPYTVPEGGYFMMGDNRNYSEDARYWNNTFVYKDKILGKVFFKYFPKLENLKDK
jgi:signal peptidase I